MRSYLHMATFIVLIIAILAATVFSLRTRAQGLDCSSYATRISAHASSRDKLPDAAGENETERMIREGALSDREAQYYRVIEE